MYMYCDVTIFVRRSSKIVRGIARPYDSESERACEHTYLIEFLRKNNMILLNFFFIKDFVLSASHLDLVSPSVAAISFCNCAVLFTWEKEDCNAKKREQVTLRGEVTYSRARCASRTISFIFVL